MAATLGAQFLIPLTGISPDAEISKKLTELVEKAKRKLQ